MSFQECNTWCKYKTVLDRLPDAVLLSKRNGQVLAANRAAEKIYGYTQRDLLSMRMQDFQVESTLMPDHLNPSFTQETEHYHADGTTIPVKITSSLLTEKSQVVVLHHVRNVNEDKRAQALRSLCNQAQKLVLQGHSLDSITEFFQTKLEDYLSFRNVHVSFSATADVTNYFSPQGTQENCLCRRTILTGETQSGRIYKSNPLQSCFLHAQKLGATAYLSIPLKVEADVKGCLTLFAEQLSDLGPEVVVELEGVSNQIALSLMTAGRQQQNLRQEELLWQLATCDQLTDLPNRYTFAEYMKKTIDEHGERQGALLLFNVDDIKVINDTFGHAVGDQFLTEVAQILRNALGPNTYLARVGGDEFGALVFGTPKEIQTAAEKVRQAVEAHYTFLRGRWVNSTVSIGGALLDGDATEQSLVNLANLALSEAKEGGKNNVRILRSDEGEPEHRAVGSRLTDVKDALREKAFSLNYQPIVNLKTSEYNAFEVLLRMDRDGQVGILPQEFLPAAERYGLMPQVDRWVIDKALPLLAGNPGIRLFVNISGQSLRNDSLLSYIENRLRASALGDNRLVFEITETSAVTNLREVQRWMQRLKELGCGFALDDFGAGFSSFKYLQALPADYIKIDGTFIRNLADPTNHVLVQAMSTIAESLGKEVIAEWVESEAIACKLIDLGITSGQGYLWGKPAALSSFMDVE